MTNDPTFTAIFRRPGVNEPGRRITMTIGPEGTRLSLDDDVLGTWSNDAILFSTDPELALTIAGEQWLITVEDPAAFRPVAELRYLTAPSNGQAGDGFAPAPSEDGAQPPGDDAAMDAVSEEPPAATENSDRSRDVTPRAKDEIPWKTLAPTVGAPTAAITTGASGVLLAVALTLEGPLSVLAGFVSGGAAFAALLAWRGFVAHRRALRRPTGNPDVDAEARVARAVARALSARTVTASLEGHAAHELTMIKGIGPQYAQLLADVGVRSIEELANLTDRQRAQLEVLLGRHGERVQRERWVEQAKKIVQTRRSSHAFR